MFQTISVPNRDNIILAILIDGSHPANHLQYTKPYEPSGRHSPDTTGASNCKTSTPYNWNAQLQGLQGPLTLLGAHCKRDPLCCFNSSHSATPAPVASNVSWGRLFLKTLHQISGFLTVWGLLACLLCMERRSRNFRFGMDYIYTFRVFFSWKCLESSNTPKLQIQTTKRWLFPTQHLWLPWLETSVDPWVSFLRHVCEETLHVINLFWGSTWISKAFFLRHLYSKDWVSVWVSIWKIWRHATNISAPNQLNMCSKQSYSTPKWFASPKTFVQQTWRRPMKARDHKVSRNFAGPYLRSGSVGPGWWSLKSSNCCLIDNTRAPKVGLPGSDGKWWKHKCSQKLENCHGFRNFYESSKTLKPKNCILHIFWSATAPAPTATCHLQAGRFESWRDCKHGFTWTYHLRLMYVRPLTWSYCKGFRRNPFTFYFVVGSKSLPTNNICLFLDVLLSI